MFVIDTQVSIQNSDLGVTFLLEYQFIKSLNADLTLLLSLLGKATFTVFNNLPVSFSLTFGNASTTCLSQPNAISLLGTTI